MYEGGRTLGMEQIEGIVRDIIKKLGTGNNEKQNVRGKQEG